MTNEEMEQEANHFAMCLLVPEKLLREELGRIKSLDLCDDEGLKKLAKKFCVSETLMTVRLHQLGLL